MESSLADPHRDHVRDQVALRRQATSPALSAALHGILAPSVLMSPFFIAALWGEPASLLPLAAAMVGGCVGLAIGVIDLPGRAAAALADRDDLLALMVMSILAGAVLGALWGGATGAVLGVMFYVFSQGIGSFRPEEFAGFMFGASLLGAFAATPGVTMFSWARGLLVRRTGPWWLANVAGMAGTIGAVTALVLLYSVLAVIITVLEAVW